MNPLKTAAIAFSTYSAIPMPNFNWQEREFGYVLCAFPLVGAVIGAAYYGWSALSAYLSLSPTLFAAVGVYLPILITGGIHLDGFCDVSDALASHQSRERKLEILQDSHIGAFAAIKCTVYLLLKFALLCQLEFRFAAMVSIGFVLSRALSALLALLLPKARKTGMLFAYTGSYNNHPAIIITCAFAVITSAVMVISAPLSASIALLFCAAWCLIYIRQTARNFGGITGDTAGYFLQICEILIITAAVLGSIIERPNI